MSDLEDMFESLKGCCLHDPQWTPADVTRILNWTGDRTLGCETSSIIIVELRTEPRSQSYGLLTQSEDYTGHGCQCGSMTVKADTLRELLTHLQDPYELIQVITR